MDQNNYLRNLNELCRACLQKSMVMKSLLNDDASGDAEEIRAMFASVTNIKFEVGDEETCPSRLCEECESRLIDSYNFQKQCLQSDELIKKWQQHHSNADSKAKQAAVKTDPEENLKSNAEKALVDEDLINCSIEFDHDPEDDDDDNSEAEIREKKSFTSAEVLRGIAEIQRGQKLHRPCLLCSYEGTSRGLSFHMVRTHKDMVKCWCLTCNEIIEARDCFDEHKNAHLQEKETCQFCYERVRKVDIVEHYRRHASTGPFDCDVCQKTCATVKLLEYHLKRHGNRDRRSNDEKTKAKADRNKTTVRRRPGRKDRNEKNHLQDEDVIKREEDVDDDKIIVKEELLKGSYSVLDSSVNIDDIVKAVIEKIEETPPPQKKTFICDICQKCFKRKHILKIHIGMHRNEGKYRCTHCRKLCLSKHALMEHERVHTGERPHICSVCGKGFKQLAGLRLHMQIHGDKPVACTLCEKRFCRPSDLKLHMRKHTGEKPYLCTECGKNFIKKSHLVEHSLVHTHEMPYQCDQCNKAFKQRSRLRFHLMAHSGYKALQCPHCSYACNRRDNLNLHIKRHSLPTVEKQHACQVCEKTFTSQGMLKTHMTSVHNAIL